MKTRWVELTAGGRSLGWSKDTNRYFSKRGSIGRNGTTKSREYLSTRKKRKPTNTWESRRLTPSNECQRKTRSEKNMSGERENYSRQNSRQNYSRRNFIKEINTLVVPIVKYSGLFLKWTRDELKQMNQRSRKKWLCKRHYIPEMTLKDYMYHEKKQKRNCKH